MNGTKIDRITLTPGRPRHGAGCFANTEFGHLKLTVRFQSQAGEPRQREQ